MRPTFQAIETWDGNSGQLERVTKLPEGVGLVSAWAPHPFEDRMIIAGRELDPRLLDGSGSEQLRLALPSAAKESLTSETAGIASDITFLLEGDAVAVTYGQAYALVWDLGTGEIVARLGDDGPRERPVRIHRVTSNLGGTRVATLDTAGRLRIWNLDGSEIFRAHLEKNPYAEAPDQPAVMPEGGIQRGALGAIELTPDGECVLAGDGTEVRVWEIATGRERASWRGHDSRHPIFGDRVSMARILDIRFSDDGKRALTVGFDSTIRVWDVASGAGEVVWAERPDPCCVDFADISSDGRHVVWAGCPGTRIYAVG